MKSATFILAAAMAIGGCETPAQRQAAETAAAKKGMAQEVERICSLPAAERAAKLKKFKDESGLELYCAK